MKFKLKNNFVKQPIKEEAKGLKRDLSEASKQSRLAEIKYKKDKIKTVISEMYEVAELDEFFGMGKFSKAKKAYATMKGNELAQLTQAYKSKDMSYVDLSRSLVQTLPNDLNGIVQQFQFDDRSDIQTLKQSIMDMIQPMDYNTFVAQSQGGASMSDFAGGASSGSL